MGDIINLRLARKAKVRAEKERVASANRVKFGRTKAERDGARLEEGRLDRNLEGSRREDRDDKGE